MSKAFSDTMDRHDLAIHREQELCRRALESHSYDALSDEEWVSLCEETAKELPKARDKTS